MSSSGLQNKCCKCYKEVILENDFLRPVVCFRKHWMASHKICLACWWGETDGFTGFAVESGNHECPGCVSGIIKICPTKSATIDLTK